MKKLILLFALILLPATGFAQSGSAGTLSWYLSDGTLTISGNREMPNYSTSSLAPWYEYRGSITAVFLDDGVLSIGDSAFYNCTALRSISIPNLVTTIGGSAFSGCTSLTSVTIPNSVTTIEQNTIYGSTGLTSVAIPNSVTTIGNYAFSGCVALGAVYARVPNNAKSLIDHTISSPNVLYFLNGYMVGLVNNFVVDESLHLFAYDSSKLKKLNKMYRSLQNYGINPESF
jgi:hypothetical protein